MPEYSTVQEATTAGEDMYHLSVAYTEPEDDENDGDDTLVFDVYLPETFAVGMKKAEGKVVAKSRAEERLEEGAEVIGVIDEPERVETEKARQEAIGM